MQCILREKLLTQSMKLADISRVYRTESHRFVDAYFGWLEEAEKGSVQLNSPLSFFCRQKKVL